MRLGILGGTFDPPHIGHLIVADEVRYRLNLDTVLFIPAWQSPHKRHRRTAPAEQRLKLVEHAIAGNPRFRLSDIEVRRGGVSYTVDTLEELHARQADAELFLIVGMDNLRKFETWRSPHRILELAKVVVMTRAGVQRVGIPRPMRGRTIICPVPEIAISSSDIRKRIRSGKPFRHLVPERVYDYIVRQRMYAR